MEDKSINDINNALNSLQKDEEQIKQEIEKLQGKYEFENGKFVEPKEVTQYKKDLERVQKEMEILKVQAMNEGKPEAIAEKMVQGRLKKFYAEICLVDQDFVKNPDKKIADILKEANADVARFARFEKGEGIEKKEENFAEEVAKQLQ